MLTLIILIGLIILGVYLSTLWDYESFGSLLLILSSFYLLIHCIAFFSTSYNFDLFVEKRNAFEQTLKDSRETGREYETAAIVSEVAKWNVRLAVQKYDNTTYYFDQYVDDRVKLLEPIK